MSRRHVGCPRISLVGRLEDMAIKTFLVPSIKWFPAKVSGSAMGAANHFPFLHGDIYLGAAGITQHGVNLGPYGIFQNPGQDIVGAGGTRRAALRGLLGLDDISDGSKGG